MNRRAFLKISIGIMGVLATSPMVWFQKPSKQLFWLKKKDAILDTYINTLKSLIKIKRLNYPEWVKEMFSYQAISVCEMRVSIIRSTSYESMMTVRGKIRPRNNPEMFEAWKEEQNG